jgi:tRNA1(Val) A37 N6-methylase TrmN6
MRDTTDDAILGGRLILRQPRKGHRVGHDAVLLAAAVPACAGQHAIELGAGVGAAALALASRVPDLTGTLIEIDESLAALAAGNIARNGFAPRLRAVTLDVAAPLRTYEAQGIPAATADHVLMNPPFNDPARQNASPDPHRRRAHAAPPALLGIWAAAAARLLRPSGTLALIWRADGLGVVLETLKTEFGGLAICPVHGAEGQAAIRILVRATKGSHAPLSILPALILNGRDGRPTPDAESILRDAMPLSAALPRAGEAAAARHRQGK